MIRRVSALFPLLLLCSGAARAEGSDQSHGQVVHLFWKQLEIYDRSARTLTLTGGARAVRGDVTVDADVLIGYLRRKAPPPGAPPPPPKSANTANQDDPLGSAMELYRVEARGHVHIYNKTDQGWGDHAIYDVDQNVMLMTGHALKVTTPQEVMTARDVMEYHTDTRISVGRGDATVTSNTGRRVRADVLESISQPDERKSSERAGSSDGVSSSKLDRAYGWGHVIIRTPTQTATGDRGVYVFTTQIARLIGHVRLTQGQNQNNGSQAIVNMKTGIATMLPGTDSPIQGLVVPNEASK